MKISAIGRGSISSFLKVMVDIAWVLACALLGFIWIVAIVSLVAMSGGGKALGVFESVTFRNTDQLVLTTVMGTVLFVGTMIICSYLRGVFETLVAGDPFVPQNAHRFRMIALVLGIVEIVRVTAGRLFQFVVSALSKDQTQIAIAPIDWLPELLFWFSILMLLVLAQVFREGAAMREEQKMTI